MIVETSNFDKLELIVFQMRQDENFWGVLNQSFTAGLREGWSNLFLKADNFGNTRNKCCFQATKSPRAPDLNLVVGRVFTLFPADWRFVITKAEPKISKSPPSEPMAEDH